MAQIRIDCVKNPDFMASEGLNRACGRSIMTKRSVRTRLVRGLTIAAIFSLCFSLPPRSSASGSGTQSPKGAKEGIQTGTAGTNRIVRDGIVIDFSISPVAAGGRTEILEGDTADVRFRLTDEGSGTPLNALFPGAWMDVGQSGKIRDGSAAPLSCREKVGLYLKNIVGIRPMIDLNDYQLLVLNQEPTISVISPKIGVSGSTNLLTRIQLKQPGGEWTKTRDHKRLFVTMPAAGQVAVIDTESFKVIANVDAGDSPLRAVIQNDEKYLWVGNDSTEAEKSGVTVIDTTTLAVAARIATGRGHHEIVFPVDDRFAFVSNRDEGTVSVIDVRTLAKVKDIRTGPMPIALAYSPLSRTVYVPDAKAGGISVLDGERHEILTRIPTEQGLGPMRFTKDGRWGLVVNSFQNSVHVVDTSTNTMRYTVPVDPEPFQIGLTDAFAYIRSLGSERVSLIQLALLGKESMPAPNNFPAGALPPKETQDLGIASEIIASPKEAAAYVLSPSDKAIYYYMEGMNAPSGSFQTYGQNARSLEIIDRSLQEREPGIYTARTRLPVAGQYDVAFVLDSPKIVQCFSFTAKPNAAIVHQKAPLNIEYLIEGSRVSAGKQTDFPFRLMDPEGDQPRSGLKEVRVLFYMSPGLYRTEVPAREVSNGVYAAPLTFPKAGAYYVYVTSPENKVRYGDLPYHTVRVSAGEPAEGASGITK